MKLLIPEAFKSLQQNNAHKLDLKGSGRFEHTGGRNDIADFLNHIFWYAREIKASDTHFQSGAYGCTVRFRLNGMSMEPYMQLARADAEAIEKRLRAQSNLSDTDTRRPTSSRFHLINPETQELLNIRISFQPTMFGQNIVCRLLGEAKELPLAAIEMDSKLRERYINSLASENGLIVVSGPTGSGKTKTMVASISYLNNESRNIATIEDPVEILMQGANQTNVSPQLSFADGLRNILRQDPDIILIGETRDAETARIAVNSAFTGHLALTTTHARNAPESLIRLIQLGVEPCELAAATLCFFSQRLLRRLCSYCYTTNAPQRQPPTRFYASQYAYLNPTGCAKCNEQGYTDRIPVFEMGFNTPEIRKAILKKDLEAIKSALLAQETYKSLVEAALDLSAQGLVDFDDAMSLVDATSEKQAAEGIRYEQA